MSFDQVLHSQNKSSIETGGSLHSELRKKLQTVKEDNRELLESNADNMLMASDDDDEVGARLADAAVSQHSFLSTAAKHASQNV